MSWLQHVLPKIVTYKDKHSLLDCLRPTEEIFQKQVFETPIQSLLAY